jgi:uncharacterized protein (TIGR00299 family) protein
MLLGALIDAGADLAGIQAAVAAVAPEATAIEPRRVRRAGLAAMHAQVTVADSTTDRRLPQILGLIDDATSAGLPVAAATHARAVFTLLGAAEAHVHGTPVDAIHFHEVGGLDTIADIVGVCAGMVSLGLTQLHASPVAVGSGHVDTAHGRLSVPPPAVARLLTGLPTYAGHAATELCTPTGAALLAHWVDDWGAQPPMRVQRIGVGAGSKEVSGRANVLRLFIGQPLDAATTTWAAAPTGSTAPETALVYDTNVDDLDPRLWPHVLHQLLDAGASDAWLTPILMKKGRPAHTLSVLLAPEYADEVRRVLFTETSGIGMRVTTVGKHPLERELASVDVHGETVSIKVALDGGVVVNVQPEYDEVVAAAQRLRMPVKSVMAAAVAAAAPHWRRAGSS